jgi:hypothetical protein
MALIRKPTASAWELKARRPVRWGREGFGLHHAGLTVSARAAVCSEVDSMFGVAAASHFVGAQSPTCGADGVRRLFG